MTSQKQIALSLGLVFFNIPQIPFCKLNIYNCVLSKVENTLSVHDDHSDTLNTVQQKYTGHLTLTDLDFDEDNMHKEDSKAASIVKVNNFILSPLDYMIDWIVFGLYLIGKFGM